MVLRARFTAIVSEGSSTVIGARGFSFRFDTPERTLWRVDLEAGCDGDEIVRAIGRAGEAGTAAGEGAYRECCPEDDELDMDCTI